ncbi:MAG: transporter substrate-binding domain-containing protein [Muribaculaceae bacterium]|nr:transporter substrate-binding domain-containing protein [Muribaculaceae bacterium]
MRTNLPKPKRIRMGLYVILLILAAGSMLAIKTCSHIKGNLSSNSGYDTITVGIQYSPVSFYMYDDTLGGLDYDLFKLIEHQNHVTFKFKPITTEQEGLTGLASGKYEVVAADCPVTAEMRDSYLFTEPAYLDRQVLVQHMDSTDSVPPIANVLDLRDATVYISQDSPIGSRLRHMAEELGDTINIRQLPYSPEQLFIRVAIGEIPCAVINEQTAKALLPDYPHINISTSISFSQLQPWFVAKDNQALCDLLDKWIKAAKDTSAYKDILNRYLK